MRTSQEIQDELSALERRINVEYIERTLNKISLTEMMTPTQARLYDSLWIQLELAKKAEGKL